MASVSPPEPAPIAIPAAGTAEVSGILEAMRSTIPGISEYELDAVAKYVFFRNGAQGDAYYSLIASGPNAIFPHYSSGKRVMQDGDFLLMDYAPDVGYYMSDVTRMWPVNGKFNDWQRELYGFYVDCYRAILKHIRPGVTMASIKEEAAQEMDQILARTKFSKPVYDRAARDFVDSYRKSGPRLGHWVGMATHDGGGYWLIAKDGVKYLSILGGAVVKANEETVNESGVLNLPLAYAEGLVSPKNRLRRVSDAAGVVSTQTPTGSSPCLSSTTRLTNPRW